QLAPRFRLGPSDLLGQDLSRAPHPCQLAREHSVHARNELRQTRSRLPEPLLALRGQRTAAVVRPPPGVSTGSDGVTDQVEVHATQPFSCMSFFQALPRSFR